MLILTDKESKNLESNIKENILRGGKKVYRFWDANNDNAYFSLELNLSPHEISCLLLAFERKCRIDAENDDDLYYEYHTADEFVDYLIEKGVEGRFLRFDGEFEF